MEDESAVTAEVVSERIMEGVSAASGLEVRTRRRARSGE